MYQLEDLYTIFTRSKGISTDTRQSQEGKLFIALQGDRFDGNDYAIHALDAGAIAAIVDRQDLQGKRNCLYVRNTLTTLHRLAHHHRMQFDIPVFAITGTNGKTTTKELVASVLAEKYELCATIGNLNNHLGVPLTLLTINRSTEMAVIEMGANSPGEIGWLCQIAAPNMGLVTNVGKAHLEGFGEISKIWDTKMDLYRYLDARSGIIFINLEESSLEPLDRVPFENSVRFSRFNIPHFKRVSFVDEIASIKVQLELPSGETHACTARIYGQHNHHNLLSAIAVGAKLAVSPEEICRGIERYTANLNRSQIVEKESNRFYLDAYNANPTSMKLALEFFQSLFVPRKVVILGDMMELGVESLKLHQEMLDFVMTLDMDEVLLVGNQFAECFKMIPRPENWKSFENAREVAVFLKNTAYLDTNFLVKGSRSIRLETILQ